MRTAPPQIYMGADHTTTNAWDGRQSVRLESKTDYSEGLFVIDLEHMPTGCATWPGKLHCFDLASISPRPRLTRSSTCGQSRAPPQPPFNIYFFNSYLLCLADRPHAPQRGAVAFWLVGPSWPNGGEIDIIEGVDDTSTVASTLHTNDGCSMYGQSTDDFTGTMETFDCDVNAAGQAANQGCGIIGPDSSMGVPFNGE